MGRRAARRYPPSYYRYVEEHPLVCVRVSRDLKEVLDRVRGDRSYGDLVREVLSGSFDTLKKAREEASRRYEELLKVYRDLEARYEELEAAHKELLERYREVERYYRSYREAYDRLSRWQAMCQCSPGAPCLCPPKM